MQTYVSSPDGPKLTEVAMPTPGPEDVLVKVAASCLNRLDLGLAKGAVHGQVGGMGIPLGLEWAGEIVEVGETVTDRQVGDRVMGSCPGAFSEFVVISARRLYAVPDGMSFTQAAAFPVALQTMHDAIATNGRLEPGQSVMIQGASTGVGLIGMQIAKVLGAGLVIGSSTTAERRARLTDFGADLAVDSRAGDWVAAVHEATGGGVDLLVDQISGAAMNDNLLATRIGGRIVNVGRLGGERSEFNFDLHALRRISYVGVTFRTRTMAEIDAVVAQTQRALGPALARDDIRMPIDRIFGFANAAAALEYMGRNAHFGKIVLTME